MGQRLVKCPHFSGPFLFPDGSSVVFSGSVTGATFQAKVLGGLNLDSE